MPDRMPYAEAERIACYRMLTVPAHRRTPNRGSEIIPQTVYIVPGAGGGAVDMLLAGRRAPERIRCVSEQDFHEQVRRILEFAYDSPTTKLFHDFRLHGGGRGSNPFRCASSTPQGTADLTEATSRACEACMDFAHAVVFGMSSDGDDFSGVICKLNRDGRRPRKEKGNLAGFIRTIVNNNAKDLFRHLTGRDGGIARIDAERVPGDLSPETKKIVAMLVERLNDYRCTAIPISALSDYYATAHGCDTATATKRVRAILVNAEAVLSRVRTGGRDWWCRRVLEPLERNRATPSSFSASYDGSASDPDSRQLGEVIGGAVAVAPGRDSVDFLPVDGFMSDDADNFLAQLRRAQEQVYDAFNPMAYAVDPEGERLRMLQLTTAKIGFVISYSAPDTPERLSSTRTEARRLAVQWVDDIIASERGARERLATAMANE